MINDMKLKRVISNVLGVSIEEINDDSSPNSLDKWDSLSHVRLVMAIEEEFRVKLTPKDTAYHVAHLCADYSGYINGINLPNTSSPV